MNYRDLYLSGYVSAIPGAEPATQIQRSSKRKSRRAKTALPHRMLVGLIGGFAYLLTGIPPPDVPYNTP